jgi:hypothetical protein
VVAGAQCQAAGACANQSRPVDETYLEQHSRTLGSRPVQPSFVVDAIREVYTLREYNGRQYLRRSRQQLRGSLG